MAIHNLMTQHLTDEQVQAINEALVQLEKAFEPLQIHLTPEERHRYGRVNEQNKLFINKVNDFATTQPNLNSPDVDWDEFSRDFKSRATLEGFINRLNALTTRATNSKILHDYDNYQESLADYAYTSFRVNSRGVGFEDKHKELKQFFAKPRKNSAEKEVKQPIITSE